MLTYFRTRAGQVETLLDFRPEYLSQHPDAFHWIDLEDPSAEEAAILENVFHFHPLAIEDCLLEVHHPKLDEYETYIFFIVHGISFDADNDEFITRELDVFLGPNYLITHHEGSLRSIASAKDLCQKNPNGPFSKGVDFLAHQILDSLFDDYFPPLDAIEDKIQLAQVEVFENPTTETLDRIFKLKRDVMQLRRLCSPQREILLLLSRGAVVSVGERAAVYFRDIYDNLYRIVEASYSYQDMTQSAMDAYLSTVSNRLNETMKRLTVVSALLMPLTVITGVYGMNFRHMPELEWRYGYAWAIGLMVAVTAALIYFFKKRRWI